MAEVKTKYVGADDIASPLAAWSTHQEDIKLAKALHGGTKVMRLLRTEYLPQEEGESDASYNARLKRSVLNNYYKRTLEKLDGQAFEGQVTVDEDCNEDIAALVDNIDLEGTSLTIFMSRVFYAAMHKGVTHVMSEYPRVAGAKTVEEHKRAGARPYWVHIDAENVIGWRFDTVDGAKKLVQLRVSETVTVNDGEYGTKEVQRVRLYTPGHWAIYEEGESGWEIATDPETGQPMEGVTSLDFIPLVTIILGEKTSDMTAKPCLDDLAELNCIHWQSGSDQRNILHYARLITYFGKMLDVDEAGRVKFGANKLIHSNSPEADLKIVEHSGAGIEAGRNDLKDLELAMAIFGLTMLLPKVSGVTATENSIEKGEGDSALLTWVRIMGSALQTLYAHTCAWITVDPAGSPGFIPYTEFNSSFNGADAALLLEGYKAGLIPQELVITEWKERGVIIQDIDMLEIKRMVEEDARANSTLIRNSPGAAEGGMASAFPAAGAPAGAPAGAAE